MPQKPNEKLIGVCPACNMEISERLVEELWRGGNYKERPICMNCRKARVEPRFREIDYANLNIRGTRPAE